MKTNEKALSKQILTEEQQLAQKAALREKREQQLADSIAKRPKGFRFQEVRSIDPKYPPLTIDFSGRMPVRKFNLSEIASKVKYITLSVPDDSLYFSPYMGGTVSFTNKAIVLNNNFGVHSFSFKGEYIETIAQSNVHNRKLSRQFGYYDKESYKGVWGNNVSVAGNRIFYKVSDYPNQKVRLFQYKINPESQLQIPQSSENVSDGSFFKGKVIDSGKEKIRSGTKGLASTEILGISSNFYAGVNSPLNASEKGVMLVTFNLQGDTLCKFSQFDKLEHPITSSVIRSINSIISWQYKGIFSFKKSFNDTIFRLIPPNRLVPAYVFNLGEKKITDEEWYQTNREISEKILITSVLEDEKYLFIEYKSFNKKGKREPRKAVFNKSTKEIFLLPLSKNPLKVTASSGGMFLPRRPVVPLVIFENDIDWGQAFWPQFVTPQGKKGMLLKPEELREYVEGIDPDKTGKELEELKSFVKTLKKDSNERVIFLVK